MRLEYPTANVDERILSVAGVADPIGAAEIAGLSAHTFLVTASIRGEVAPATVRLMKERSKTLALDVQGFVRTVGPKGRLQYEAWPERDLVLGMVDILKTDAVEAEFLTGTADIQRGREDARRARPARDRADPQGRPAGAGRRPVSRSGIPPERAARPQRPRRYLRRLVLVAAAAAPPAEATRWAAALTSLKLEAEGPIRRSRADVERLLQEKY